MSHGAKGERWTNDIVASLRLTHICHIEACDGGAMTSRLGAGTHGAYLANMFLLSIPQFFLRSLRISLTIDSPICKYIAVATEFTLLHITPRLPTTLPVGQFNTSNSSSHQKVAIRS